MSLKKLFGSQLKLIRKYRKMTQENLSESVNIDIRQLARIEAGESFATAETIEKLCSALQVSYNEMFNFPEEMLNTPENMTSDSILEFKKNYNSLLKIIQKIAQSNEKTEYLLLAADAITKKEAREKLKSILFGMTLN